jgi:hypothetical protein
MHAVWDSGIVAGAVGGAGWRTLADRLAREVTPAEQATWIGSEATAWAQESYNLTTRPRTEYCRWRTIGGTPTCAPLPGGRALGDSYQREFEDDVTLRLQQAGVRLADLLRQHLLVP